MDQLTAHPFLESLDQDVHEQAQPTQKNKFSIRDFTLTSAFEQLTDLGLPDLIGKVYRHWQHSPLQFQQLEFTYPVDESENYGSTCTNISFYLEYHSFEAIENVEKIMCGYRTEADFKDTFASKFGFRKVDGFGDAIEGQMSPRNQSTDEGDDEVEVYESPAPLHTIHHRFGTNIRRFMLIKNSQKVPSSTSFKMLSSKYQNLLLSAVSLAVSQVQANNSQ